MAAAVELALGLPVLRHGTKKPAGAEAAAAFFGCEPRQLVFVGDRYATDVVFANMHGMLSVHVPAITAVGDPASVRLIRPLERALVALLRAAGVKPVAHDLYSP